MSRIYQINGKNMNVIGPPTRPLYYPWPPLPPAPPDPTLFLWWTFNTAETQDAVQSNLIRETTGRYGFGRNTNIEDSPMIVSADMDVDSHVSGTSTQTDTWARRFNIVGVGASDYSTSGLASASNGVELATMFESSSYTAMMRFRKISGNIVDSVNTMMYYGPDTGAGTFYDFSWTLTNSTNRMSLTWSSGSAGGQVNITASNGIVAHATWYHAAVKREPVGDGTWDVTFFLNGSQVGKAFSKPEHTHAKTDLTNNWRFGRPNNNATAGFTGDIRDVVFYSSSLSNAEILSAASATSNLIKADTLVAYWPFDEKPVYDSVGSHHLTPMTASFLSTGVDLNFGTYSSVTNLVQGLNGQTSAPLRDLLCTGSYTFESWLIPQTLPGTLFTHGAATSAPVISQTLLAVSIAVDGAVSAVVPSGSTATTETNTYSTAAGAITAASLNHLVIRKTITTFPRCTIDFFVNGAIVTTFTDVNGCYNGSRVDIGRSGSLTVGNASPGTSNAFFPGTIYDIKLWRRARSNYEINQAYLTGSI